MRKGRVVLNGRAVAALRSKAGLSQPQLAERIRALVLAQGQMEDGPVPVAESTIAMIETGKRPNVSADVHRTLALALDVEALALGRVLDDGEHRCPTCLGSGVTPLAGPVAA